MQNTHPTDNKFFSKYSSAAMVILIGFHLLGNLIWIFLNKMPPAWDEAAHTTKAVLFAKSIINTDMSFFEKGLDTHYGPFVALLSGIILSITGPSIQIGQIIGTLFFIALIIQVYLIGRDVFKDEFAGIVAAVLLSFGNIVVDYSRWLHLDIPVLFFVLAAFYFFMQSKILRQPKQTAFFFLFVTFALYTKIQTISYFGIPFLLAFYVAIKEKDLKIIRNIVIGGLAVLVVMLPWIIYRWSALQNYFSIVSTPEENAYPTNIFYLQTWLYYLKLITNQIFTFPIMAIVMTVSLIYGLKKDYQWKYFLWANLLFIYISYTFFTHKDIRYIFPGVAFLTIIAGISFSFFIRKQRTLGLIMLLFITVLYIATYISGSFGVPGVLANRNYFVSVPVFDDITFFNTSGWPIRRYVAGEYPQNQILEDLASIAREKNREVRVGIFINIPEFNDNNLNLYRELLSGQNKNVVFGGTGTYSFPSVLDAKSHLKTFDYILISPDRNHMFYQLDVEAYEQIESIVGQEISAGELQIEKLYTLPTGERVYLLVTN